MDVADNPNLFPERIRGSEEASLEYPIVITEKNQILDGNHRVLKSILLNRYMVKAKRVSEKQLKSIEIDFSLD